MPSLHIQTWLRMGVSEYEQRTSGSSQNGHCIPCVRMAVAGTSLEPRLRRLNLMISSSPVPGNSSIIALCCAYLGCSCRQLRHHLRRLMTLTTSSRLFNMFTLTRLTIETRALCNGGAFVADVLLMPVWRSAAPMMSFCNVRQITTIVRLTRKRPTAIIASFGGALIGTCRLSYNAAVSFYHADRTLQPPHEFTFFNLRSTFIFPSFL